jgi:hypothetical protein
LQVGRGGAEVRVAELALDHVETCSRRACAGSCVGSPPRPASAGASRPTSCVTPTRSSWREGVPSRGIGVDRARPACRDHRGGRPRGARAALSDALGRRTREHLHAGCRCPAEGCARQGLVAPVRGRA